MLGSRTSPVDGLNMNRSFPGDAQGSITEQISEFIANEIFPRGNAFLDLHSGGSSLDILPSAVIEPTNNGPLYQRNVNAARAFDAPVTVVVSNYGDPRTATAAACQAGLTTVGTEMGGGGTVNLAALALCHRGVANLLQHFGVCDGPSPSSRVDNDQLLYELAGQRAFVYATADGIFEPYHLNGQTVHEGEKAGRIHCTWDPQRAPEFLYYQADGILYGRRQPGRVRPGNCCLVVASSYEHKLE
jgi:hypothetical protein